MAKENDPFDVMVGERIALAIHAANLDKDDVCKRLGVHVVTLNRYIRGAEEIKNSRLRKIAAMTDRPLYFFLTNPGERKERPIIMVVEQSDGKSVRIETGDSAEIKLRFER